MLDNIINQVKSDLNMINIYADKYNSPIETYYYMPSLDGIASRVSNITECILCIVKGIRKDENLKLNEAINYIIDTLDLNSSEKIVMYKLRIIEDLSKDYVNSDIYKLDLAEFFSDINHRKSLKNIINKIDTYLNGNSLK